jgi:hypothetical protein
MDTHQISLAVAEKVFGRQFCPERKVKYVVPDDTLKSYGCSHNDQSHYADAEIPEYALNMNAACRVAERLRDAWNVSINSCHEPRGRWVVELNRYDDKDDTETDTQHIWAYGETMALAICKAALAVI